MAARGRIFVKDYIDTKGEPIRNKVTGAESRAQIVLPEGFEYAVAEIGSASSKTTGPVQVEMKDTYGQFARLHLNNHGVVRSLTRTACPGRQHSSACSNATA